MGTGTIHIRDTNALEEPSTVTYSSQFHLRGQGLVVGQASGVVPWYRTYWAVVAFGVAAIGLVALIVLLVRWRTAYLERRHQELEELVAERTREVQRRTDQLETYNAQLLRTNEVLRETVEEKSKLLGMAAHDLKNPLFGIRALSEIVLETKQLSDKNERKVALIRESAAEALHLIDNLLASAANSAQTESEYESVDLSALAQWVVRSFEPHAERKQQDLQCTVTTDESCVVEGDEQKLREALNNLVSNALKYSPPGEAIDVFVDRRDGTVRVEVVDAGPGLSKSDQRRMFAPFQRLSPDPTGGEGSSGLGLYIVKQVAEMHEGSVDVDSELDEGSTFALVIPVAPPETDSPQEIDPANMEYLH